jgi:hypothetical protein
VKARRTGSHAEPAARLLHGQEGRDLAQPRLDRPQPYQITIELLERLGDARLAQDGRQIDAGGRLGPCVGSAQ